VHVELDPRFRETHEGRRAAELISACVHCGFCLETCPTYLDRRDERDSPRGRIYLVKQLLETGTAGAATRTHLDRCLTCRSCETTCPSGMRYGELLDIGRGLMEIEAPRGVADRLGRLLLRAVFSRPALLTPLIALGRLVRPLLPGALRSKIPPRQVRGPLPAEAHTRHMVLLEGCVQSVATPRTNGAARRVLDKLGITLRAPGEAGCCGALAFHLGAQDEGLDCARRNIDAWWPLIEKGAERGAEAVVSSASGCGAMIADYGRLLADDPDYADRARQISQLHRDLAEVVGGQDLSGLPAATLKSRVAVHCPCTQQHALGLAPAVPDILRRAGLTLADTRDGHLCCGSAGTHALLEPGAAGRMRRRALDNLCADAPELIATANVGCQLHLQGDSDTPVVHWIELLDRD